jgi:hypothetical protein
VLKKGSTGKFRFNLVAPNGQVSSRPRTAVSRMPSDPPPSTWTGTVTG